MKNNLLLIVSFFLFSFGLYAQENTNQPHLNASATEGCAPLTVNFNVTGGDPRAVYFYWYVNTSTNVNNSYRNFSTTHGDTSLTFYNQGEDFYVSVDLYGLNWDYLGSASVGGRTNGVSPWINSSIATVCPNTNISFWTNYNQTNYFWDFGDGTTQSTANSQVAKSFPVVGTYNVMVKFTNECGGVDSAVTHVEVQNNIHSPVQINANATTACPGAQLSFYSEFTATNYIWFLGDTLMSGSQYAYHAFSAPGNYSVKLKTLNGCGIWDSTEQSVSIQSNAAFPQNMTIYSPEKICPGEVINMGADYGYKAYQYDFGDGTVISSSNYYSPQHVYSAHGIYNASIKITSGCGTDTTIYKNIEIRNDIKPSEQYYSVYGTNELCPGSEAFYSANGPMAKKYSWSTSEGYNDVTAVNQFKYTFDSVGVKTISVNITNFCMLDTTIVIQTTVNNNMPVVGASAYVSQNAACPGEPISFGSNAEGNNKYFIVFSNAPTDTIFKNEAKKDFSQTGNYTVYYGVTNSCGNDTLITKTIPVVSSKFFGNNLSIYAPSNTCVGAITSLGAPYGYKNYSWYINGQLFKTSATNNSLSNYNFSSAGNVEVKVKFQNYCGNDTTLTKNIVVGTQKGLDDFTIYFQPSVCPGDQWGIDASLSPADASVATFTAYFGDGDTLITKNHFINHIYDSIATYQPKINITTTCGADTTIQISLSVGTNAQVNPNDLYMSIDDNGSAVCTGSMINFYAREGYKKYFWDFGNNDTLTTLSSNISKSFNTPGNYRVRVSSVNGCNNSAKIEKAFTVSNTAKIGALEIHSMQNEICVGDALLIEVSGVGKSGITYSWDYGDGTTGISYDRTASHIYNQQGTFNISLVAANLCGDTATATTSIIVGSSTPPTFFMTDKGSAIITPNNKSGYNGCPGDAITMLYLGNFSSDNFDFGDGTNSPSTSSMIVEGYNYRMVNHIFDAPGNYWVRLTVTNGCGLSAKDSILIKIGSSLTEANVDILMLPSKHPDGYKTCIPVEAILAGGKTYQVNFGDGNSITTTSSYVKHTYDNPGFYVITSTGTNGCGKSSTKTVQVNVLPGGTINSSIQGIKPTCYNGNNGAINLSVSNGISPYSFSWRNYESNNSSTLSNIPAGVYYVIVTDSLGCSKEINYNLSDAIDININTAQEAKPACTQSNGYITVAAANGHSPYTYSWVNGNTGATLSNIPSGLYYVTAIDSFGCSKTAAISLLDANGPSIAIDSNFSVLKVCKGSATANVEIAVTSGTSPYTYTWSNNSHSPSQSNLAEGNYSLTVHDNAGCRATKQVAIEAYPAMVADINVVKYPDCKQNNGEIAFSPRGGSGSFELSVDGGQALTGNATGLSAGKHTLTITDLTSFCTKDSIFYIDNASSLNVTATYKNPKCYGSSDGLINISNTGGTPNYFSIVTSNVNYTSPKSTKTLFNGLSSGTYYVKVEDKVGCLVNKLITLKSPDSINVNAQVLSAYCGSNNGEVTGLISGGVKPYSLSLNGNTQNSTGSYSYTNLSGNTYTLQVTDSNFCVKNKSVAISTEASNLNVTFATTGSMCGREEGSVDVNLSGGYQPYTYSWSNGSANANGLQSLNPGAYSLTVIDNRNCSISATATIDTIIINPGICLVTVDSASEKNRIVWEKPLLSNIQSFNIYKEGSIQNDFVLSGNVPINQLSEYLDAASETRVHKDRYLITSLDSCGNESLHSSIHETIHLTINAGVGTDWNLIWNNYGGLPIGNYSIWRSTDSINYTFIASRPAAISPQFNTYTDVNAPVGDIYYTVSFDAPNICNSGLFKTNPTNQPMGTFRKVKSNVSSNRTSGPSGLNTLFVNHLEVYPNPTSGLFTLEFGYFDNPKNIEIINPVGQVVSVADLSQIQGNQIQLNLTNFESGVYMIRFVSDKSNIIKRLVKY